MAVSSSRGLREPRFDGSRLYWLESRPAEGGRSVIMTRSDEGVPVDVMPAGFNARSRVHEYGGGSYAVSLALAVFSNFSDDRLYRQEPCGDPEALTPAASLRYADIQFHRRCARLVCVVEDHREGDHEPRNLLGSVSLADGSLTELVSGADFFGHVRVDAAGERLAWLQWNRPNMPWDGCELWVGTFDAAGHVVDQSLVAGGASESIAQPVWAADGSLVFASDRTGWWNLYRWRHGSEAVALAPMAAEFAGPAWVFGGSEFQPLDDGRVAAVVRSQGRARLFIVTEGQVPMEVPLPWTEMDYLVGSATALAAVVGSAFDLDAIAIWDVDAPKPLIVRTVGERPIDAEWIAEPEHIEFPTAGGRSAHALLYRPRNPGAAAAPDERPPLIVISHGGPTSNARTSFSPAVQFFTTRGFAVVDVDYGGSTGYGREYRNRLYGNWGVVDLEDCVNAARWLAWRGIVDAKRLAIRGGSAGGYTTLCGLCFSEVFSAGASYFGVGDLESLARDTHKFESRYLDLLVAPYPGDVAEYRRRSPIHFVDRIRAPLLLLQGAEDRVVPKGQADLLVEALAQNGVPYAYLLFEGEGHGFRRSENMRRSLEAELSFYGQVFRFTPADDLPPLDVTGLAHWRRSDRAS